MRRLALLALAVTACSHSTTVGNPALLNLPTTTVTAPAPTTSVATTTIPRSTPIRPVSPLSPTTSAAAVWTVTINGDQSGKPQFAPAISRVVRGTVVRFVNDDTTTRSVVAAAFGSGPIRPGGSWNYTTTASGTFSFQDGTRPYAVGQLTVVET